MAISKDFRVKNGLVVEQDISFGGSFKDLSGNLIELGGTSSDTYTVKDELVLQQSETPIGTVVSKSSIPSSTTPVTYTGGSSSQILSELNYNYGYFYGTSAAIYPASGILSPELLAFFAVGKTVTIEKNGYTWTLQITILNNYGSYMNISYNITSYNAPWSDPSSYDGYYSQSQSISFTGSITIPEQYVLTLNAPTPTLTSDDKLIINGSQTGTPVNYNLSTIGNWQGNITGGSNGNDHTFTVYNTNPLDQAETDFKNLMYVGTYVTIVSSGYSGVYLVKSVGPDTVWNTAYGFSAVLTFISGDNLINVVNQVYWILKYALTSISGTVNPNYTTDYIEDFATAVGSTYLSFNQYSYLNIGDTIDYIPGSTSVKFKDDAGNNIKAITYNNSSGEISYDGIVQTLEYVEDKKSYCSIGVAASIDKSSVQQSVALGYSTFVNSNSVAIGSSAYANTTSVAIGINSIAGSSCVAIGYGANANSSLQVAIGESTYASGYMATAVGYGSSAYANYSTAIGKLAYASINNQFSYATSGQSQYRNQTTIIQYGCYSVSNSGVRYLYPGNEGSTSSSALTLVDLSDLAARTNKTMAIATAKIMFKPANDENDDDCKVLEMKFVVRTTASNQWTLNNISSEVLYAGTGSLNSNWNVSFEITNNRFLNCVLDKGSDTTRIGVTAKVEFQVLSTD